MSDPWQSIRHTLSVMPAQSLIPDPIMGFLVAEGKRLLADADALLAVIRKHDVAVENGHYCDRLVNELPDHLRPR